MHSEDELRELADGAGINTAASRRCRLSASA